MITAVTGKFFKLLATSSFSDVSSHVLHLSSVLLFFFYRLCDFAMHRELCLARSLSGRYDVCKSQEIEWN